MSTAEHDRRVDYVEFGATDLDATRRFYTAVFGWTFTDYGPEYTSFADGRLTGGFAIGAPPGGAPLVVIYVSDLAAARSRVTANQGRISRDIFSFPGGRRFHFHDPNGNELAVWSE